MKETNKPWKRIERTISDDSDRKKTLGSKILNLMKVPALIVLTPLLIYNIFNEKTPNSKNATKYIYFSKYNYPCGGDCKPFYQSEHYGTDTKDWKMSNFSLNDFSSFDKQMALVNIGNKHMKIRQGQAYFIPDKSRKRESIFLFIPSMDKDKDGLINVPIFDEKGNIAGVGKTAIQDSVLLDALYTPQKLRELYKKHQD